MNRCIQLLDRLTEIIGKAVALLLILMMLVTCALVLMRYLFQSGNIIFMQESVAYMHAAVFMLGAGWTLKQNGHVRVDIFYRRMSPIARAWVDALGILLFLLPFAVFLLVTSLEFVGRSWSIREASGDAGGIPYVYLLKTLIPSMCALLILQGIAELLRNGMLICVKPDQHHDHTQDIKDADEAPAQ